MRSGFETWSRELNICYAKMIFWSYQMNILPIDIIFICINKMHIALSIFFVKKKSESTLYRKLPDLGVI